mgnify:FL=1
MLEANEKVNILQFLVSTRPSPSTLRQQVPLVLETGRVLGVESYSATYHQILCKFNYMLSKYTEKCNMRLKLCHLCFYSSNLLNFLFNICKHVHFDRKLLTTL